MTSSEPSAASPYATGGGGVDLETEVVSYYLAAAVTRSISRGLPDAVVGSVTVQAAAQGEPLDDLVIHGERADGHAKLSIQVRRKVSLTQGDAEFADIVRRVWQTLSAPEFHDGVDAAGVAIGVYQRHVDEHYQRTLTWARTTPTSTDFVRRLTEGYSHEKQRTFVTICRSHLTNVFGRDATDDEVWRFLRAFVVLYFDFQAEGSRDLALTEATLRGALPLENAHNAADLRNELVRIAMRLKRSGGLATTDSLRTVIGGRFAIRETADVRGDLRRLRGHAEHILGDVSRTIADVALPRADIVVEANEALDTSAIVFVVGAPGAGKSAVVATMYEDAAREGAVLLISGERLFGTGWDTFAHGLGVVSELREILATTGVSATPTIFIDGIDRAETADKRRIVNDLLRTVSTVNATRSRPWKIVASCRDQNVQAVLEWTTFPSEPPQKIVTVPALSTPEVAVVVGRVPQLRAIAFDTRLSPVTHNAFMLARLTDARILQNLPAGPLTEVTLTGVWWRHVVSDGTPAGRSAQQALIRIAEALLAGDAATAAATDSDVLHGLENARIIVVDPTTLVPRFLHDIYEDWVLYHATELHRDQMRGFVTGAVQPFRLRRAVRLYGCALLERGDVEEWHATLAMFESDPALAARWRFAFLSSPLLSVRSDELLASIRETLFADNGRRLIELLRAARTLEVAPNLANAAFFADLAESHDEVLALLLHEPQPRWSVWISLLRWLLSQPDVPIAARDEAVRILELWQIHTPERAIHRDAVADTAWTWLGDKAAMTFARDEDEKAYYQRLRRVVFRSADVRPENVKTMVHAIAGHWSDDARDQLLKESQSASRYIAKEYVDAVLKILLPRRDDRDEDDWHLDYGFPPIRDMYPPAHVRPPFLTVLRENEAEGLRLIHVLANTAIDRWRRKQMNRWDPIGTPVPATLTFPWGTQDFWGGPREYYWFRGDSVGPHAVVSALMALEFWMEQQLSDGRGAEELFQTVLTGSRCIALPALCLGLTLQFPTECLRSALPLLSHPILWLYDVQRVVQDMTGTTNFDPTGRNEFINKLRKDRDQQPQRRTDIRTLSPQYLFNADQELTERFSAAIARFTEDIPVLYEEQRTSAAFLEDTRRTLARYQAAATRDNYRLRQAEEGIYLEVEMPRAIVEQDASENERLRESQLWTALWMWGENTLKNQAPAESMSATEVIDHVRRLYKPELFAVPLSFAGIGADTFLVQGVAAATAALAGICADAVRAADAQPLMRKALLAAAATPEGELERGDPQTQLPWHPRAYAARGLGALIRDGDSSDDVREAYLRVAGSPSFSITTAASLVLPAIWTADRDLVWRAVVLTVVRSKISPWRRDENSANSVAVDAAVNALHDNQPVSLPRICTDDDFYFHVFNAGFTGVPLLEILADATYGANFRTLIEELVGWTLTQHAGADRREQIDLYEWTTSFGDLLAVASAQFNDATYNAIIGRYVDEAWRLPNAELVTRYVSAFLNRRLSLIDGIDERDVTRWHDLVSMLLATENARSFQGNYRHQHVSEPLAYFVFVSTLTGGNYFADRWPHAHRFEPAITAWVTALAKVRRAYRWLLIYLDRFFDRYSTAVVLRWLCLNGGSAPPVDMFADGDTGDRLAGVLLKIWKRSKREILADADMERRYASMIDHLLLAGITMANVLAERLARRE